MKNSTPLLNQPRSNLSGSFTSYYLREIAHPQNPAQEPYIAECEDIIHALGMTFDEGNIFKSLWRMCAARQGNGKVGSDPKYDAEKILHYAKRILKHMNPS